MESSRVLQHVLLLLGVLCGLSLVHACTASAQETRNAAAVLEGQIEKLRRDGEYDEALEKARELLALLQGDEEARPHEVIDAEWLVATLERIVDFTEEELRKYAVANGMDEIREICWSASRFVNAEAASRAKLSIIRALLGQKTPPVAVVLSQLGVDLQAQGDFAGAEALYREALEIECESLGPEHPNVASNRSTLGTILLAQGDYVNAEALLREALIIWRQALGPEHPNVATGLTNLGGLLWAQGDSVGARVLFRQAEEIKPRNTLDDAAQIETQVYQLRRDGEYNEALGKARELLTLKRRDENARPHEIADMEWQVTTLEQVVTMTQEERRDFATADSLSLVFQECMEADRLQGAVGAARLQREIYRGLLGGDHPYAVTSLNNLATALHAKGECAEAEPLLRDALATFGESLGLNHPQVAACLSNLGALLQDQGQHADAESLLYRALAIKRKTLDPQHRSLATTLHSLGMLLQDQKDYMSAEPLLREALSIRREKLEPGHPDLESTRHALAMLLYSMGEYVEAWRLLRKALLISTVVLGPEHSLVGTSLSNLAKLFQAWGDYGSAESLYRDVLSIVRSALGSEHRNVAICLNNLGEFIMAQGKYAEAEPVFREALAIVRETSAPEDPYVANCLGNLGALLAARGDYTQGESLQREALAITRRALGTEHPNVAACLNNLGVTRAEQGDLADAERLYREALEIARKTLPPQHPDVAAGLHNLAMHLQSLGDHAGAEAHFREALKILQRTVGPEHPKAANCLDSLGELLSTQGDYSGAEALLRQALETRRRTLGPEHPDVAISLTNLAWHYHRQGACTGAESLLTQAAEIHEVARLRVGSGLERSTFGLAPHRHLAAARLAIGNRRDAWPPAEKAQARVLTDLLLAADQRELNPRESARGDSLLRLQASLERQLEFLREAARTDSTSVSEQRVDDTRTRLFATQAALGEHLREVAKNHPVTEGEHYPLDRVQAALPVRTALIGWLDVCWEDWRVQEGCESWCYVIRRAGPVLWEQLEPPDLVADSLLAGSSPFKKVGLFRRDLLTATSTGSTAEVSRRGRELWTERVAPMVDALRGIEELIVIPSGAMLGIPIEALMDDTGAYLGDRYKVSYTPSATIYAWLAEKSINTEKEALSTFLLIGIPDFQGELVAKGGDLESARSMHSRILYGDCDSIAVLPRLKHAQGEVESIADLCPGVKMLLGPEASEPSIVHMVERDLLKDFDVIHIATHGEADGNRAENSALALSPAGTPDPLKAVLSGERLYDCRVTVKEILQEWELDAELVTLSACQTGLGEEIYDEGLVGFTHAFLQKNTRSLLLSLWNVSDKASSLLMERFYENLLGEYTDERAEHTSEPMSKVEALQEAKHYIRTYNDAWGKRPYEHPYFWAGFVLIGERE